jgi:hypothetical protein
MRPLFLLSFVKRKSLAVCSASATRVPRYSRYLVRMASTLPSTPIFDAIAKHDPKSRAIIHGGSNRSFCYGSLLHDVAAAKDNLTDLAQGKSLRGERIAFLAENGYDYVGKSWNTRVRCAAC